MKNPFDLMKKFIEIVDESSPVKKKKPSEGGEGGQQKSLTPLNKIDLKKEVQLDLSEKTPASGRGKEGKEQVTEGMGGKEEKALPSPSPARSEQGEKGKENTPSIEKGR